FAIEILAAGDKALEKKLQDYKKELADKVKSTKF
ncbi:MAG: 5-(carboxyamino)imidazole ribonucleotide mutase, partial [Candidatus Omnitrophica bacterium CG_4_8_14_3_um_filter_43_15]